MKIDPDKLIAALKAKKITQKVIDEINEESTGTGKTVYEIAEKKHLFEDEEFGKMIADILGYPYVNLSNLEIPSEILEIVPENIALKQGIITFQIDEENNKIKIATINPLDLEMINDIQKKTGREPVVYYTTKNNIKNIIGKYHQELKHIFLNLLPEDIRYGNQSSRAVTDIEKEEKFDEEIPIVKIFDEILVHAYRHHASDIHIEATKDQTVIRYRIDGVD